MLMDDLIEEEKGAKYTNEQIRKYININLFLMSVKLKLKITTFEETNKSKIFWMSIMVSLLIIVLTYFSGLVRYFPYYTSGETKRQFLMIWDTISKIFGADLQTDIKAGYCVAFSMRLYVMLFFFSSIDVFVMKQIRSLQIKLTKQLAQLESQNEDQDHMDNFSDDDEDKRNEKKFKRMTNMGLNLEDYELEGLDEGSEISSIESEGEDGKIISKREKDKKLKTLLGRDKKNEKYDDVIRTT